METRSADKLGPFVVLTFIYFIVGFLTTVNGQCQGPLKIAFLADAGALKNTFVTLISFFFFLGYLICSPFGGRWINRVGYKRTLLRSLGFMIAGLAMFWASSWFTVTFPAAVVGIGAAHVPGGYFIFLTGSFLMGTAAALSQVVINPYISAYELPGTQSVQRMNIVCAINSFGTMIAPFFVTTLIFGGRAIEEVEVRQLMTPFLILAVFVVITTLTTMRMYIPDLSNTRAAEGEHLERSIWSFRHFTLGVVAIFFYVGAEVAVGSNINLHALEMGGNGEALSFFGRKRLMIGELDLGIPAMLATIYWGGMMVGRMISSTMNRISPRIQLTTVTLAAIVLMAVAVGSNNLWLIALLGFFQSVMWSCIFTLSVQGLEKYTAKASGIFMMGVFGGAVFPVLQGIAADLFGTWRWTWLIVIFCELVILFYALIGSRVRNSKESPGKCRPEI
ncbi:MFS transporter [Victivallis vadensis]|uniref:MFS transporter n=1 Tax=Victivallis vadensis TaxID=172901 RepID=UPI000D7ADC91|nr:MAG: MFS transporter [Lentisphaerota bacterium]